MTPSFSPDVLTYSVEWEHSTSVTQTVTATANQDAEIMVWATYEDSGVVDIDSPPPKTYDSNPPPQQVNIQVSNGVVTKTYRVSNTAIN